MPGRATCRTTCGIVAVRRPSALARCMRGLHGAASSSMDYERYKKCTAIFEVVLLRENVFPHIPATPQVGKPHSSREEVAEISSVTSRIGFLSTDTSHEAISSSRTEASIQPPRTSRHYRAASPSQLFRETILPICAAHRSPE